MPCSVDAPTFATRSLLTRAAILHAELDIEMTRSSVLLVACRQRQGQRPRLRPIRGGSASEVSLLTTTIAKVPLCIDCIVKKTGVPTPDVTDALWKIAAIFKVTNGDRCHDCLRSIATFCLDGGHA